MSSFHTDAHQKVTARIIEAIEQGAGEFVMPWNRGEGREGRPVNAATGRSYQGGNVIGLWAEAMLRSFTTDRWASYKQWQTIGGQVRFGERGTHIVYWARKQPADDEEPDKRAWAFARSYTVYNADQVDGWTPEEREAPNLAEALPEVERFIKGTGALIREGYAHACYRPLLDWIEVPKREFFRGSPTSSATECYYATILHELVHWTGAECRLKRTFGQRFGDNAYAAEELVAELGSAFLCTDLGIANDPRPDHAAYLAHWLAILRSDCRAIFSAASLASAGARYLREKQPAPHVALV